VIDRKTIMKVQQLYTKCLAQGAYFVASKGEAIVIDPLREVDQYIALAKENNATIKYIFETHFHADFVSGHIDLARQTGATIVYGPTARPAFDCLIGEDGQRFAVGDIQIQLIHTPGHTPESSCYLLLDERGVQQAIFTGDTLFLGDVGRPDLAINNNMTQADLAGMLFDSLRTKIMILPDHITVYPGHGAGSACGKNMSSDTQDTLGNQKKTNYALRADMTKDEFVDEVTTGILPPPQYFPKNAHLNKMGYTSIDSVIKQGTTALSVSDFRAEIEQGALILDVRPQADFISGFIPNSLFIGLNGQFAIWAGTLIENIQQRIVLIAPPGSELEAVTRLARVGYDNTVGYLNGGIHAWDEPLNTIMSISPDQLAQRIAQANTVNKTISVVDVRKPSEWHTEHLPYALHYPLDFINNNDDLDKKTQYYVHCAGGYRSVIAISILMQRGYSNLIDIAGGFGAIKKTPALMTQQQLAY